MKRCHRCKATLSAWELQKAETLGVRPCWCDGIPAGIPPTLANLAYRVLCGLSQPVKVHDVIRLVEAENYKGKPQYSINVTLSQDRRFCWAGKALYGLPRHGLVPGVRTLAEAAYIILLAAPRELHVEEVDFVLEQLNYRFNSDSLAHHLRGYTGNRLNLQFHVDSRSRRISVNSGRDARHDFNKYIRVFPTHVGFDSWIEDKLAPKVQRMLKDRTRRLANLNSKIELAGDRIEFR